MSAKQLAELKREREQARRNFFVARNEMMDEDAERECLATIHRITRAINKALHPNPILEEPPWIRFFSKIRW